MSRRTERLNHLIRDEITQLLQREIKDPRLEVFVTVTRVSISPDLRHVKVFVSIMGTEIEKTEAMKALDTASGFLRRELGMRVRLRYNPELSFGYDDSMEQAGKVLQLMSQLATEEAGGQEPGEH
jgi:ribosome-binding factor A